MGRPRSKNRMSRMVQARVTDEQYNYLAERAYEAYDGDLSAALRGAIVMAGLFEEMATAPDPAAWLREKQAEWAEAELEDRGLRMDSRDDEEEL